jgi:hypothetical protein
MQNMLQIRNAYNILVGNPEEKILLERPMRRTEGNKYSKDLREGGWDGVDWIHLKNSNR